MEISYSKWKVHRVPWAAVRGEKRSTDRAVESEIKELKHSKSELLCSPFLIRMKSLVLLYFNPLLNGAFVCVKSAVVVVPCIQLFIQCIFQSPILHIWPCKSKPYSGMSSTKNNQFACIKRRVATDGVLLYNDHFWLLPFLARWRFTKNIILQFYSFSRYKTSSEFSTLCYCAQLTLAFYGLSLSNWMDDKWELLYCLRNSFYSPLDSASLFKVDEATTTVNFSFGCYWMMFFFACLLRVKIQVPNNRIIGSKWTESFHSHVEHSNWY